MPVKLPPLQVVFFDFGATLIYTKDLWPPFYRQADRVLLEYLHKAGIPLDKDIFSNEFGTFLDLYYADRGSSIYEKTTLAALRDILTIKGFRGVPEGILRTALDSLYSVTQQNWYLEDDTVQTLEHLRERGFRMGMISNSSDDMNVFQLLDKWDLRPFFEVVVTSAGCGIRKPDGRIFQEALARFHMRAEETVMVGDTLEADILGANRIGMHSLWITRRAEQQQSSLARPEFTIARLGEIPGLLSLS